MWWLALPFILLGIYGGMCAIGRWVRGYTGYLIFSPAGVVLYAAAAAVSAASNAAATVGYPVFELEGKGMQSPTSPMWRVLNGPCMKPPHRPMV